MKVLLLATIALFAFTNARGQNLETLAAAPLDNPSAAAAEDLPETGGTDLPQMPRSSVSYAELTEDRPVAIASSERFKYLDPEAFKRLEPESSEKCCADADAAEPESDDKPDAEAARPLDKFHWKPAILQSLAFLTFQHTFRVATQDYTRAELGGNFFKDWGRSVANLRGWEDGDNFLTNYIGHPMQGALTGRIYVNNSERGKRATFGPSKAYWSSRLKAMAWSAAWSTQFELGPISEATIGNVGMKNENDYSEMSYLDLVVTPVAGTAVMVGEDVIDKYFLENWLEKKSRSSLTVQVLRTLLTPTTSIANILRGKVPWKRDHRPLFSREAYIIPTTGRSSGQ